MNDRDAAIRAYELCMFEILVNIKAVNSRVCTTYIKDMESVEEWAEWKEIYRLMQALKWIPKQ